MRNLTAVGFLAQHRVRRRWRNIVALVLMVGVVGGVVLGMVAGAHRTASALNRFEATSRSADLQLETGEPTTAQLDEFRSVPGVEAVAVLPMFLIIPDGISIVNVPAAVDTQFGTVIDRARVIEGREADPSAVNEIAIGEGLASLLQLEVGDYLDAISATPAEVALALAGGDPGMPTGPNLQFLVVGIVRRPLDLGSLGASGGLFVLTPAFYREYSDDIGVYVTRLRVAISDGDGDLARVESAAREIFGESPLFSITSLVPETEGARDAIDVLAVALWIFAAVAALGGLVAISIVVGREVSLMSADEPTLSALGLTRKQRMMVGGPEALIVAVGGASLAALVALAMSPLFPINVARRAEPTPGTHLDWIVLGLGTFVVAAVVFVILLFAALRGTRRSAHAADASTAPRIATIPELTSRVGFAPTVTNGVRMALQRGPGRSAAPVRSAIVGAVFGVLGITAGLVFASSFTSVIDTPQRYGWTWDFTTGESTVNVPCGGDDYGVAQLTGIEAMAELCYAPVLQVDGRSVSGMAFASLVGSLGPEIIAGRAPIGPNEIALGATTLDALGKSIGDTVNVASAVAELDFQIVGQVILPPIGYGGQPLADGAALTVAGHAPLFDINNYSRYFVGRFAPKADRAAVLQSIASNPQLNPATLPTVPAEIDHLRQIDWIPAALAALLGAMALLAVGHALVVSVQRRRGEFALMKSLGSTRRQVRATVVWQATTLTVTGLVVGIPAGLVIGKLVWGAVADGLGIATTTTYPTVALFVAVAAILVLVNLVALPPAEAAARTRLSDALRSE